jgi:hypothetical protein
MEKPGAGPGLMQNISFVHRSPHPPGRRQEAIVSEGSSIPKFTIRELQESFERANKGGKEPQEWEAAFRCVFDKWNSGAALCGEEIEFLAIGFTALSETPEDLLDAGSEAGVDVGVYLREIRSELESVFGNQRDSVIEAKKRLDDALARQLFETEQAHSSGDTASTKTLKGFYAALEKLKRSVKQYSGTPPHRPPASPDLARSVQRMRSEGKTYGEITHQLNRQNPKRKVTAKQVERLHKRYREGIQKQMLWLFRETFKQRKR